jgi:DNA-binding transcriptional MerR regulator
MGDLVPFGKFVKLFPQVSPKTLLWWVTQGLIPFSDSQEDGRGVLRLFSPADIAATRAFVGERLRVRKLYRIKK